jgi:hypothetical protein
MAGAISVRSIQTLMGALYGLLACVALARSATITGAAIAVSMVVGAYFTSRTIPDAYVRPKQIFRVCRVGLVLVAIGTAVDLTGQPRALAWALVVMAYCAGNRLRAAGIGPAA